MKLIGTMGPKEVYSAHAPNGVNFHHTFHRVLPANEGIVAKGRVKPAKQLLHVIYT